MRKGLLEDMLSGNIVSKWYFEKVGNGLNWLRVR
jgi:hypothetical protein